MRRLYYFIRIVACLVPALSRAQSPTVPLNADYYHLIDRFEIKRGRWAEGFHSSVKPYNRHQIVQLTDSLITDPLVRLSRVDVFTLNYLRNDSWEWVPPWTGDTLSPAAIRLAGPDYTPTGDSRRRLLKVFYHKVSDFYSTQTPDFDLHINPAVDFGLGTEIYRRPQDEPPTSVRQAPYINTRGVEIRGSIKKRLGFYSFLSDNQALFPEYVQYYGDPYLINPELNLAPGEGLTKRTKVNQADFISARGYITFNALKIINLQFGHDRHFFGNGFRSLFLSDNSAPFLFMKITTTLGRFQYTNLFAELQNTQRPVGANQLFPRKYTTMHHLSVNLGPHVNLGVFETQVFSREQIDLNYLNPIIFYRYVESYRGSADNAMLGLDLKVNFLRHFLGYSQFLIDEFLIRNVRARQGSWTNKFAFQAGLKYIDAFGIPNLDLQAEMNLARPYTYSHRSGQTNYVHYNQPLAHPLGANFIEGLGIIRYQPLKQWMLTGTFGLMRYGADPPSRNYGGDLLKDYETRFRDKGNLIAQGRETIVSYGDLRLSFMLRHNLFVDLRQLLRMSDSQAIRLIYNTSLTSVALRWNMPYRNFVL